MKTKVIFLMAISAIRVGNTYAVSNTNISWYQDSSWSWIAAMFGLFIGVFIWKMNKKNQLKSHLKDESKVEKEIPKKWSFYEPYIPGEKVIMPHEIPGGNEDYG